MVCNSCCFFYPKPAKHLEMEVDSHFHVWDLQKFDYPWPNKDTPPLFRTIAFDELKEALATANVKNAVFVQCLNNNIQEAKWVLEKDLDVIKGVVAGVDLIHHDILREQLRQLTKFPKFVGVRHILDMEAPDWIMQDSVVEGLKIIADHGLTFDFLARPKHLGYVWQIAKKVPTLQIVIDHIAKPILSESLEVEKGYKENMKLAAENPNVYCKISGLVTEVDPVNHTTTWSRQTFQPHINFILSTFGADRCMIGSDWPVLKLTNATYKTVNSLHKDLIFHLAPEDKQKVLGGTAFRFYKLRDID